MVRREVAGSDKRVRTGHELEVVVILEGMGSTTGSTAVRIKRRVPMARGATAGAPHPFFACPRVG